MSPTAVALPRLIELRSQFSKKLLRYVKEEGEVKGFVQFSGEHVGSPEAKFEVHSSETGNGLVHIRSCYNNRYLRVMDNNSWIAAKAEKPEEDQSKRLCTLLRPTCVDGDPKKIRLTNVHRGNNLCLWRAAEPYYACVLAIYSDPDPDSCDVFNVIDWQSLVLLPKYVVFKGDNDKFLRARWKDLQFSQTNVEDDPMSVGNEIVQTSDGKICLRNMHLDQYWRLSRRWICADSKFDMSNEDTLFEAVKYSDDTIALRNVANNLFCTRLRVEGKEYSCLNAGSPSINSWAKLKVSEPVISRKIENINFRLMDARIYGESITMMVSSSDINQGSTNQERTFDLSYTDKKSSTWNSNISMKASIEASFKAGIPLIMDGDVKVGFEISGGYMWGETKEVEEKLSSTYMVTIPSKTKVTVRIMATRGTCDVPFSYTQRDVLYSGETVTTEKDDGVYTGVNNYSYYTEVKEESLIKVSELVISRKIENIKFRLMDARIYGESIAMMVSSSHINQGNTTHEQTFDLSYTDKKSNTWNSSISMKASYEMSYQVGLPLIFEGEIKLGLEIGGQYTWGETKEVEEKISSTYKLLVPPKTKVTARIMATRGTCDVPFSYTKRDVLYTGETVTTDMDDGVYTGVNNYSYYTEVKEESLINDPKITTAGFNKCSLLYSKITDVLSFSQDFFY